MDDGISSSESVAASWQGTIQSGASMASLAGVDDDNTLAESGIYNSHGALRSSFMGLQSSLNADAANIVAAARALSAADAAASVAF